MPTLVDLANPGAEAHSELKSDGHSLLPILKGSTLQGEDVAYVEYLAEGIGSPHLMIRRGQFKYIFTEGDPELLFDMQNDPSELVNLAGNPQYAQQLAQFRVEQSQRWNVDELTQQVIASQQQRHLVAKALATGTISLGYQPFSDLHSSIFAITKSFGNCCASPATPASNSPNQ